MVKQHTQRGHDSGLREHTNRDCGQRDCGQRQCAVVFVGYLCFLRCQFVELALAPLEHDTAPRSGLWTPPSHHAKKKQQGAFREKLRAIQGVSQEYQSRQNNYICKSLVNSKTISVSKKITKLFFAELITSKNNHVRGRCPGSHGGFLNAHTEAF